LRLYDLRHSAATIALAAGVSPKVVSEQLGHASTAFTLDTYAHVLPHMQDEAVARVEAMLFGATICDPVVSLDRLFSFPYYRITDHPNRTSHKPV
jgi:hypothetical protein